MRRRLSAHQRDLSPCLSRFGFGQKQLALAAQQEQGALAAQEETAMNVQPKRNSLVPETVTTGPLTGSRKVYATPTGWNDVHVPLRQILLSDPAEPELYVYDASGPYTEVDARIDLAKGLLKSNEAKYLAVDCLQRFKEVAGQLVGSTAFFRTFPLERMMRDMDVHSLHRRHHFGAVMVGQAELGLPYELAHS